MALDVPDAVRRRALAFGAVGAMWLRELPGIVDELEWRWDMKVGAALSGGTVGYVATATLADGTAAVVKVAMPAEVEGEAFDRAVRTFALVGGRGCARLLAHDASLSALLLERLGRSLEEMALPVARQLEIICATLREVWQPVPGDAGLPTGAEKAAWLAEFIATTWEALGRPCSAKAVDIALGFASERARRFDPSSAVLVHGDAHAWNTLEAADGSFKLVDPEGLVSEPAHDLAIPMREFNDELLSAGDASLRLGLERAELLSRLTAVDRTAIWQWGFVERVSTGLYALRFGHESGHRFLAVADTWAEA